MLRDSLEHLADVNTPFRQIYAQLARYVAARPDWQLLDLTSIGRDLPLLDAFQLASAMDEAVKAGILRPRFTVLTPDGVVARDIFSSPSEIPRVLPDRFEEPFETRNYPLVALFEAARGWKSGDAEEPWTPGARS